MSSQSVLTGGRAGHCAQRAKLGGLCAQWTRGIHQHHRDVVFNCVDQRASSAKNLFFLFVEFEIASALWTNEDLP